MGLKKKKQLRKVRKVYILGDIIWKLCLIYHSSFLVRGWPLPPILSNHESVFTKNEYYFNQKDDQEIVKYLFKYLGSTKHHGYSTIYHMKHCQEEYENMDLMQCV